MSKKYINQEIVNDLLCRFIINTPECERSLQRIGFKLQDAYWHFLDFYCEKLRYQKLTFHDFIEVIKNATPFLRYLPVPSQLIDKDFQEYKKKIPRYGCIIVNQDRTKILLVKNATSKKFGFPKGQINYNENPVDCAIRETIEEIGFNVAKYIMQDVCLLHEQKQNTHCYFIADRVSDQEKFKAIARNEIDDIKWVDVKTIRKRRNDKEFSNIVDLIDSLQVVINKREENEFLKYQHKNKVDFQQSLKQIQSYYVEFCQGDCLILTEDHIYQNESQSENNSTTNPFMNFSFDMSKF